MLTLSRRMKVIGVAICFSIATPVFAESAPVFDADAMQDDVADQAQYLPPPPPPGQESGSTFVPMQSTASSQPAPQDSSLSMDQRVQRMEQQVSNMQSGESANRVESLQNEVQSLRGQIEQLTHQLDQVKNQQKSLSTDTDGRLSESNGSATEVTTEVTPRKKSPVKTLAENTVDTAVTADTAEADDLPVSTPTEAKPERPAVKPIVIKTSRKQTISSESKTQPNVVEEQQIYQTAYNLIKARRYNDAVTALQSMLKKYPSGQFASNAHYWLGELYGLMGKNDQALNEFTTVVDSYPESPRVSDAQLKVGLLLASQLKWPEAKSALKRVINHYPGSASARLAAEQLKQIKIAGH